MAAASMENYFGCLCWVVSCPTRCSVPDFDINKDDVE